MPGERDTQTGMPVLKKEKLVKPVLKDLEQRLRESGL
jgi:hypothetical protein